MKIHRAYRYELDPNAQQRILLAKHAGAARFAYNWGLARWEEIDENEGRSPNAIELHRRAAPDRRRAPERETRPPEKRRRKAPLPEGAQSSTPP
ncbi:helix-turn-helix domain-containing protein [Hydrogenibacillus sp. N12]|uniref:helix-turn-helix domain-containing protein n=1 Tax=Hydrogenibacillus sp. N12 TaxID=2866627 RepID=UPI001C7DF3EB|nr:helix-turn-helix domain-containing protein [Hydrogenibacillus sp. N12]QZA33359.1 helix-turn-helix domain-containing protein [Hydrogenibacillus sp. N12]